MRTKRLILIVSVALALLLAIPGFYVYRSMRLVPRMFKLNRQLAAEGYHTAEFEFKMLGLVYELDRGRYWASMSKLNGLYHQLESRQGLLKVPAFATKNDELEFYLALQNPKTGAFMDDAYPYCTYYEPTMNMIAKIEGLTQATGRPLKLKYPLRFLDQVNSRQGLQAYLDDLATVGWIGSKFKAPYLLAAKITSYHELEEKQIYTFSPDFGRTLLEWFYRNQDGKTGFWGPRKRGTNELVGGGDLGATFSMIDLFLDEEGRDLHPEYPLQHKNAMLQTALKKLAEPMPGDADLDEIHDWSITRSQGVKLVTRFLLPVVPDSDRQAVRQLIGNIIRATFEKLYVPDRGAFSLYPGSLEPDLDGTGGVLGLMGLIGVFQKDEQERLWRCTEQNIANLGEGRVDIITADDLKPFHQRTDINSIRAYSTSSQPVTYYSDVICVLYPQPTPALDMVELAPKLDRWLRASSLSMGMWTSREHVVASLSGMDIREVPVSRQTLPLDLLNQHLRKDGEITLIGFDALQIPVCKMKLRLGRSAVTSK